MGNFNFFCVHFRLSNLFVFFESGLTELVALAKSYFMLTFHAQPGGTTFFGMLTTPPLNLKELT